jgi:hypothetical protein
MSAANNLVGETKSIPYTFHINAIERTNMYENPNMIHDFQRDLLMDRRPDRPLFPSDEHTGPSEYSTTVLNLREHGGLASVDPYLPEGTFLDFEFTRPDTNMVDMSTPNLEGIAKQQRSRYQNTVRFYDDNDHSVHSGPMRPTDVVSAISNSIDDFAKRIPWFSESETTQNRSGCTRDESNRAADYDEDARRPLVEELSTSNAPNYVQRLSNTFPLGYTRVTDHEFTVSNYDRARANPTLGTQDWAKNRYNTKVTHDIQKQTLRKNSQYTVAKITDTMNQKRNLLTASTRKHTESAVSTNRRLNNGDAIDVSGIQTSYIQPTALMKDSTEGSTRSSNMKPIKELNNYNGIYVQKLAQSMASVNPKMTKKEIKSVQDQVLQSYTAVPDSNTVTNIVRRKKNPDGTTNWFPEVEVRGTSIKVNNYAALQKLKRLDQSKLKYSSIFGESKQFQLRQSPTNLPTQSVPDVCDFAYDAGPEALQSVQPIRMRSKYTSDLSTFSDERPDEMSTPARRTQLLI